MFEFKAITKHLQPTLFCAVAVLGACDDGQAGDAPVEGPEATPVDSAGNEDVFRARYSCLIPKSPTDIYCLVECRTPQGALTNLVPVDSQPQIPAVVGDTWCQQRATAFCANLNMQLEHWCWGIREEEDPCHGIAFDPGNGIVGCWYTSPQTNMSCTEVCAQRGGFNVRASQHTGNAVGRIFYPGNADGANWESIECSSTDNNTNWGANGSVPDPNWRHQFCRVNCACRY